MQPKEKMYFTMSGKGRSHPFNQSNPYEDPLDLEEYIEVRNPYLCARAYLAKDFAAVNKDKTEFPVPPAWGSYVVKPTMLEFLELG